jgi:hypothetical protein
MKYTLLILAAFFTIIIYANINYEHGINGMTLLDGGTGCICHGSSDSTVNVWIEGTDTVFFNNSAYYKLKMTGGPAVKGGFDLAVRFGILDSVDTLTHILFDELTHTFPNPFINDTVTWEFMYTAPNSGITDTIYSVANSVNGDGNPEPGDKWNFGVNFPVFVMVEPLFVENETIPAGFYLSQNYPNPFNPGTKIKYRIPLSPPLLKGESEAGGFITLKVYDVLGNEVATLVNEESATGGAGEYEVVFDGSKLTSGIYFYRLQLNDFVEVKKMILLR